VGPGALLAFTALQLAACCALLVSATTIFVRDPTDRGNRAAALLIYSGAAWGVCQLLWNTTDDPELALLLVRLSALGWVFLGPLSARFILSVTQARAPHLRKTMAGMLDRTIRAYPEQPPGAWWLPASYGGGAPTPAEAERLDEEELARRAARRK